jgi:glycosyltransferase involved in cell wall biosynthesis
MPKISFVMPTKNRGHLIENSIRSVLRQTEKDWELIIVDDHSDPEDKTELVVRKIDDKRIRYVRLPENWGGGIPEARNFGNMLAESPIIAVADSDDISLPKRAELTIKGFEEQGCDVFYGQFDIYHKETGIVRERSADFPVVEFDLEKMKQYDIIPHGSSAYRRELAYQFPYNSFFRRAQDYDLFIRLGRAGKKFYFCKDKIYRYTQHKESVSNGGRAVGYDELLKLNNGWATGDRQEILAKIVGDPYTSYVVFKLSENKRDGIKKLA